MQKNIYQKEITIQNRDGLNLSVRLTFPPTADKIAFLEHGFSGNKNEPQILIAEQELAQSGHIVINLDAANSLNESGSSFCGPSFSGHYTDLQDVIKWAEQQEWFKQPFTLAGHSMGAAACLFYAENFPNQVNLLLPLSFPWASGISKVNQENSDKINNWKTTGYWDKISKHSGKTLHVPYNYIEDLLKYDFIQNADKITAQTVLIIGDLENKIRLLDNQKLFNRLNCPKDFILLPNTPHCPAATPENAAAFRLTLQRVLASAPL